MTSSVTATPAFSLCFGVLLVAAALTTPVATAHTDDRSVHPEFEVALESDGSATVTVQYTYDLGTDAEQEAFRSLEDDQGSKTEATDRFASRLAKVAAATSNETGRTMRVTNATIDLRRAEDNTTGVVTFTLDWSNIARVDGDRLVLTEPFASGYDADRSVTVRAPDGYRIGETTPEPASSSDAQATWEPGTDFEGFELVVERADESGATGNRATGLSAPGFGVLAGVLGLFGALLLVRRQRA